MKPELDDALCWDFPLIFRNRHADMRSTCMCWGFECGDGWEPLIRRLCEQLEAIRMASGLVSVADQVKEKYGTLRFYVHFGGEADKPWADIAWACADAAVRRSGSTCEECGKYGTLRDTGWIYTRCDACWAKMEAERAQS